MEQIDEILDRAAICQHHPGVRVYRIVMRSGVNMDITAKAMRDDPACDVIYFFHDESQNILVASVKRDEFAGLIIHAQQSSAIHHY